MCNIGILMEVANYNVNFTFKLGIPDWFCSTPTIIIVHSLLGQKGGDCAQVRTTTSCYNYSLMGEMYIS